MTPEQIVQAHLDLRGKHIMPILNGTFDLAFHAWYEPLERVTDAANKEQVNLLTPDEAKVVTLGEVHIYGYCWKQFMPSAS
ncbi:hypothetical protein [Pseudoalteromonas pernae]|uniref:hypothetical protein n=1 Tax=Pseudoalteromonas pernae TaxID=3118054 RepID=UPI003F7D2F06